MLKRGNKKAQGLSTNAIILIVLGVVVLAVLIIGFTIGWNKIAPWLSTGESNIDTIIQQCTVACSTSSINDFCLSKRDLKVPDHEYNGVTCYTLSLDNILKTYGIDQCTTINCKSLVKCSSWTYLEKGKTAINVKIGTPEVDQTTATDAKPSNYCSL